MLTYSYDNLDRVTQILYPDGTTDLYDYTFDGTNPSLELRKYTDRLGRVTKYAYDAGQHLTSVTDPSNHVTSYYYYENGVLKDIIDADGNDTRWNIDLESRPVSKTYAYGTAYAETETYTYEQTTNRLKSITDALNQTKNYTYALDNRLTNISYTNPVNPTPSVTFDYDQYFPRLDSMLDGTGTTTYSYVPIGTNGALQLMSETGPYTNDSITYGYDVLGRMNSRTIPGGNESFGYDAISRLNSHTDSLGTFTYGYLGETSQLLSRALTAGGAAIQTNWTYDTNANDRRLIGITNSGITRSYTLSYLVPGGGGANNPYDVQSITDTPASGHPLSGGTSTYTYDMSDRLTAVTSYAGNSSYGYDPVDNATSVTIRTTQTQAQYNPLNEIKNWGTESYSYDANGNLLSGDGTRSYKWDAENRLIEIDYTAGGSSKFTYDGLGRRVRDDETASGVVTTTFFFWCDSGHLCQVRDGSQNPLRRDLSEGEYFTVSGERVVYMPDQLGSTRDILDGGTGMLTSAYNYYPYGTINQHYNSGVRLDYRFAGLFYHPASGLNLGTYRAEDGVTGRFINRDPLKNLGGLNLYTYVGSNPLAWRDPSGLIHPAGSAPYYDPPFDGRLHDDENGGLEVLCTDPRTLARDIQWLQHSLEVRWAEIEQLGPLADAGHITRHLNELGTLKRCQDECEKNNKPQPGENSDWDEFTDWLHDRWQEFSDYMSHPHSQPFPGGPLPWWEWAPI